MEDDIWSLKGRYNIALEDDEPIHWSYQNGQYILPLLIVSSSIHSVRIQFYYYNQENNQYFHSYDSSVPPSVPPSVPSTSNTKFSTPAPVPSYKDELIALLSISPSLTERKEKGIRIAFQKYKAYIEASQTVDRMVTEGNWPGKKPSSTDLIEIFVSKSVWHSHYKPFFSKIPNHPEMVAWLEEEEGHLSDLELWGVQKHTFTFQDLKKYLDNKEQTTKDKGKKKADSSNKGESSKSKKKGKYIIKTK